MLKLSFEHDHTLALGVLVIGKSDERVHLLAILIVFISPTLDDNAHLVGHIADTLQKISKKRRGGENT